MSRRPKRARAAVVYERPWTEAMHELFDLVAEDWIAPATVRVRRTARAMTVTAIFNGPTGRWTAHARIALQGDEWVQTEESLSAAFSLKVA